MFKKFFLTVFVFSCCIPQAFCSDIKDIFWQVDPDRNITVLRSSSSLVITPHTDQIVVQVKSDYSRSTQTIAIMEEEEELKVIEAYSTGFKECLPESTDGKGMLENQNYYCDITSYPVSFTAQKTYHKIHNAGYIHSSNEQIYDEVTFKFSPKGAVCLNAAPKDEICKPRGVVRDTNDIGAGLLSFLTQNLSPKVAGETYAGDVQEGCAIKSIKLSPLDGKERLVPLNGRIGFGKNFEMALKTQGTRIELKAASGFQFADLK